MRNLIAGMNGSIGPTGTHQIDRVIRYTGYGTIQLGFNRAHARFLELPAMKRPAIVFQCQNDATVANGIVRGKRLGVQEQELIRLTMGTKQNAGSGRE